MPDTENDPGQLERDVIDAAREYRQAYDAMVDVLQDVVRRVKDRRPTPLCVRGGEGSARAHLDNVFTTTLDGGGNAAYERAAAAADAFDAAWDAAHDEKGRRR